jgi:hypothetical protein
LANERRRQARQPKVKADAAAYHAADMRLPWLIPRVQERAPVVLSTARVN